MQQLSENHKTYLVCVSYQPEAWSMEVPEDENGESQDSTVSTEENPHRFVSISDMFRLNMEFSSQSVEGQQRRKKYKDCFCFQLDSGFRANVCFHMGEIIEGNELTPHKIGVKFTIKSCAEENFPISIRNPRDFTYRNFVCLVKLTFLQDDGRPSFVRYFNTGGTESNQTLSLFERIILTDLNFCSVSAICGILQKVWKRDCRGVVVKEQEFISMKMEILARIPANVAVIPHTECYIWRSPSGINVLPANYTELEETMEPKNITSKMKTDDSHTDTVFMIKNERIKAHIAVLAAASDVFEKIFHDRWSGSLNEFDGMKEIPVSPNVTAENFRIFLDFIYGHNLALHAKNTWGNLQSLELANYYNVDYVSDMCIKNLVFMPNENFSVTTGLHLFAAGRRYVIQDLEFRANQWLVEARKNGLLKSLEGRKEISDLIIENGDLLDLIIIALTEH